MRSLISIICIIFLLLPLTSSANQSCFPCLAKMINEGSLTEEQLQSILSEEWNEDDISTFRADGEEITPDANLNINTLICYYFAYRAIFDLLDCVIYYDYYCRSAVVYGLAYYYFCN